MTSLKALLGKVIPAETFSSQESEVLVALQDFIDTELSAAAMGNDQAGRYPTQSMAALRRTGVTKAAVPQVLGGPGFGHKFSLECQLRLATADSSVAQLFKVHDELVREILVYCPALQRQPLAQQLLDGSALLGLAVAEPGKTAEDPMKTLATERPGGGFIVDGFKIYTTAAAEADLIATWAFNPAAATEANPLPGMQLLLIPKGTPGVTVNRDWDALGQRATDSGSITFEQVQCDAQWVASVPGKAPLVHASVRYQAGFAAILTGIGIGALRAALPYIQERSRPWKAGNVDQAVDDPFIRRNLGEHAADLAAAYHMTLRCGELLDAFERGEIDRGELALPISAAKSCASRAALNATSAIHGLMGTGSVMRKAHFDYWWRNARTLSLHDPVEWKHHEMGRHLLTGWDPEPGIYQ